MLGNQKTITFMLKMKMLIEVVLHL